MHVNLQKLNMAIQHHDRCADEATDEKLARTHHKVAEMLRDVHDAAATAFAKLNQLQERRKAS